MLQNIFASGSSASNKTVVVVYQGYLSNKVFINSLDFDVVSSCRKYINRCLALLSADFK